MPECYLYHFFRETWGKRKFNFRFNFVKIGSVSLGGFWDTRTITSLKFVDGRKIRLEKKWIKHYETFLFTLLEIILDYSQKLLLSKSCKKKYQNVIYLFYKIIWPSTYISQFPESIFFIQISQSLALKLNFKPPKTLPFSFLCRMDVFRHSSRRTTRGIAM